MEYRSVQQSIHRLERFQRNFSLVSASTEEIDKLKRELRFLRTYLMYKETIPIPEFAVCKLYDYHVSKSQHEQSGSTSHLDSIEVEFIEASSQLHNAINELYQCGGRTLSFDPSVTSLLEVIKHFEPQISEYYTDLLKERSWQSKCPLDPAFWLDFTDSVLENLEDLLHSKSLIGSKRESVESLQGKLKFLRNCVYKTSKGNITFRDMGALLGYSRVSAGLSYLGWSDAIDENKLSHLLQKINPSTQKKMAMYFTLLKASNRTRLDNATADEAVSFTNFLIDDSEGSKKDQFAAIRDGLVFLITFVMDPPDPCTEDEIRISGDIQALACEAASLNIQYNVNEVAESQVKDMNFLLSRLLAKMKLIKSEIFLIRLLQPKNTMVIGMEDKFTALFEGLKSLRRSFADLEVETIQYNTMFFSECGKMTHEVTSLISSIHANKKPEKNILILCLEKIKLIRSDVYLLKMQNHKVNWMVPLKDQIQMLRQGLASLRTFLMDRTYIEDKTEEGKLFLTYLQAVTTESSSLIYSFFVGDRQEMVDESNLQVSTLVRKIKFLKALVVLEELLNHGIGKIVQMKIQIKSIKEGLIFLSSFFMDPPRGHMEHGQMILKKSELLVKEAASLICSVYDDLMEEGKVTEIAIMLSELLGKIMDIKSEIQRMYFHVSKPLQSKRPRIDGLGFISSLLKNLKEMLMLYSEADSIVFGKNQIESLHGDLDLLRSFLIDIVEQHNEQEEIKALWTSVTDIAYEAENVIDSFLVSEGPLWYRMLRLRFVIEEINAIKMKTYDMTRFHRDVHNIAKTSKHVPSHTSCPIVDEVIVGFSDEADKIIGRLTRGSAQMNIISITGMPGLGKTTLAKKVYNDPSVTYHFYVRAWCCISQVYQRRDLLLDILGDIVEVTDRIHRMTDEDIAEELYRCLKGKRYLIVMDDIWDIKAWEDLRLSFPNDHNGSRVLFTSRLQNVALQAKPDSHPHHLRLLSDDECWELLQGKIFHEEGCPEPFKEVGKVIAMNCKGLPLAVVVIAGLLGRTEQKLDWWKEVSQSLNSQVVGDPQGECMHVLKLSYNHLPDHLKSCFLYFGAFTEGKDIPVSKLLRLWVAEGFFHRSNSKSLEDSAEECLLDLISRSLVIVSKRGSDGGVKAVHIHDLLRILCMEMAKEENFLQLIQGYELLASPAVGSSYSHPANALTFELRRLCICSGRKYFFMLKPHGPCVRSLLFFASNDMDAREYFDLSIVSLNFKLIRVLDLESIDMGASFPTGLELLVLLRYLALRGSIEFIPSSVSRLWNLETFLVKGLRGEVVLPYSFWEMRRLRHVHVNNRASFSFEINELGDSSLLHNVDSLSTPVLYGGESSVKMMRRFPRLRKLRCIFYGEWDSVRKCNKFPALDFLSNLESLKVFYYGKICHPCEFRLPGNIKKLTLSKFCLPWSEISTIGRLPNLEVLKLLFKAFEGKRWDMRDGEFPKLKYLKLESLDIGQWNASADHFPCLQQLVLQRCKKLEQVPYCLGEISTLEMIEVNWCSHSAARSVRQIQEEQQDMGNEELKVLIYPPEWAEEPSVASCSFHQVSMNF